MGIYGQPTSWQCGPFALKHGLLAVGVFAHEDELTRIAGSSEAGGTDDVQLARAARAFGCRLLLIRRRSARAARRALVDQLATGVPVLLCLDQWEHWVTVVAEEAGECVLFDSHLDTVLRIERWERLRQRLAFRRRRWRRLWRRTVYDLHPLVPLAPHEVRLGLTLRRAAWLLSEERRGLAATWDEYARRLLPLTGSPGGPWADSGVPLATLLRERRAEITDSVAADGSSRLTDAAERALDGFALAAELYGVHVAHGREREAVGRIAAAVAEPVSRGRPVVALVV